MATALTRRASQNAGVARALRTPQNLYAAIRGYRYGAGLAPAGGAGVAPSPSEAHRLEAYFDAHTEGPGIWKWRHYFEIYERYLAKFVGRDVHVVEIGVFGGGSLAMWRTYFGDRSRIYGVDREPGCRIHEGVGIEIIIGDQASPAFWAEFRTTVPLVDVVIDDGGHQPHQQIATLEALLPHIRPGGVYICEDVHGSFQPFHSYVDGLTRSLHEVNSAPRGLHHHVNSVHAHPGIVVIEKPTGQPGPFEAPKRRSAEASGARSGNGAYPVDRAPPGGSAEATMPERRAVCEGGASTTFGAWASGGCQSPVSLASRAAGVMAYAAYPSGSSTARISRIDESCRARCSGSISIRKIGAWRAMRARAPLSALASAPSMSSLTTDTGLSRPSVSASKVVTLTSTCLPAACSGANEASPEPASKTVKRARPGQSDRATSCSSSAASWFSPAFAVSSAIVPGAGSQARTRPVGPTASAPISENTPMLAPPSMKMSPGSSSCGSSLTSGEQKP